MAACLFAAGCSAPSPPPLIVVQSTGPSTETDAGSEAPDDAMRELATTGINAGILLGPLIKQFAALSKAFYDARTKYGKASYGVLDIDGWTFQNGWYAQKLDDGESTLRAQFQDQSGAPVPWDVTLPSNYDPDLHDAFPAELTQIRLEVDKKLPGGGRMALSLFAPMAADPTAAIESYGSGSATLPPPLGQTSFEALNAIFPPGGEVDHGTIGLKSLTGTATLQFTGSFYKNGLDGAAKLIKNGHAAGDVVLTADGHWQIQNAKGTFPLQ